MSTEISSAIDFYERHPISSDIILAKLKAARGHLDDVAPEELFPHDQDHYGGLDANDALAARSHHTAVGASLLQLLPPADERTAAAPPSLCQSFPPLPRTDVAAAPPAGKPGPARWTRAGPATMTGRRRSGRAVECTGLENRRGRQPSVGSNPTSSATFVESFYQE